MNLEFSLVGSIVRGNVHLILNVYVVQDDSFESANILSASGNDSDMIALEALRNLCLGPGMTII